MAKKLEKIKSSKGFVLLFAVTLAAIFLSMALGVADIALKEVQFGTSAKDTNNAFFAADTGAECAAVNDKSTGSSFTGGGSSVTCLGGSISLLSGSSYPIFTFIVNGLNSDKKGCAVVTVYKNNSYPSCTSSISPNCIISQGYSNGSNINGSTGTCGSGTNTVERELDINY